MSPTDDDTAVRPLDHGGRLGPYTLVSPIGAGGMGVVYRARDERLGRDVAIKVIRPGLLASRLIRRVGHPPFANMSDRTYVVNVGWQTSRWFGSTGR